VAKSVADSPTTLAIYLGDSIVGFLTRLSRDEVVFTFDKTYAEMSDRPVLTLGYETALGVRLRRPKAALGGRIQPFFSNLLPEDDLREYVAERAGIDKHNDFALLWITGDDLPGAVRAVDTDGRAIPPIAAGGPKIQPPLEKLFRFSLAGVQMKFGAIKNAAGGLTIPVSGRNGSYILKLPSTRFPEVPENEHSMMTFAREVGIDVPEVSLVDLDQIDNLPDEVSELKGKALVVRRFDRTNGKERIHIEDFNQIYRQHPEEKYENVNYSQMAGVIYSAVGGSTALQDFVQRLAFNLAICNNDMHLKNWSVIYKDGQTANLAPGYDFLCTAIYKIKGRHEIALDLGGFKAFAHISEESFERLADKAGVSKRLVIASAREMRDRIRDCWPRIKQNIDNAQIVRRIEKQFEIVPFFNKSIKTPLGKDGEHTAPHQEVS
jgi:serine/threonine-protein kinase HipA